MMDTSVFASLVDHELNKPEVLEYKNDDVLQFHYLSPDKRDSIHIGTKNLQSGDTMGRCVPLSNVQQQLSHWPDSLREQFAASAVLPCNQAIGPQQPNWQWPVVRSSGYEDLSDRSGRQLAAVQAPVYPCPPPPPHALPPQYPLPRSLPVVSFHSNMDFPGKYNFKVMCEKGITRSKVSKSVNYTYSDQLRVLFVKQDSLCPVRFYASPGLPRRGCQVRAMVQFRHPASRRQMARRCPKHLQAAEDESRSDLTTWQDSGRDATAAASLKHLMICENKQSSYYCCQAAKQLSVVSPFFPPAGDLGQSEYVGEIYTFKCFSSCYKNKGPLQVVFSLEVDGQVVGRQTIDVHICASPGRDRRKQEKEQSGLGKQVDSPDSTMPTTPPAAESRKRQKISQQKEEDEESVYTLTIRGKQRFEQLKILSKALDALEMLQRVPPNVVEYYNRRGADVDKEQTPSPGSCPVCADHRAPSRFTTERATQTEETVIKGVRFSLRRTVSLFKSLRLRAI